VPARVDDFSDWINWVAGENAPPNEAPRPEVDVNTDEFLLSPIASLIASNLPALDRSIDSSESSPTQPITPAEAALTPLLLRACGPRLIAGAQPKPPVPAQLAQPAHAAQPTKGRKAKGTANPKRRAPPTPTRKRKATRPRKAPAKVTGDPFRNLFQQDKYHAAVITTRVSESGGASQGKKEDTQRNLDAMRQLEAGGRRLWDNNIGI
jgi:hypothetical protein